MSKPCAYFTELFLLHACLNLSSVYIALFAFDVFVLLHTVMMIVTLMVIVVVVSMVVLSCIIYLLCFKIGMFVRLFLNVAFFLFFFMLF